jgi:predicted PurR-regulated permease PerM
MPHWNNLTRTIVIAVSLILTGWLLYTFHPLVSPLIIAALLAYMVNPLVVWVQHRTRFQRKWAVAIVYFCGLAFIIAAASILTPIAVRRISSFMTRLVDVETKLEILLAEPIIFAGQELHLGQSLADLLNVTGESIASVAEGTRTVVETTSVTLLWLLVILVSVYYLLLDGVKLRDWLIRLAPDAAQPDMSRLFGEINIIWRAYLRGTFVLMLVVGVVFTLVWLAIGLPGAIVLGILTGLLTVIPEIGPAIAALLAVLIAYFQGSNLLPISPFWFAVLVFSIYFVLIQIKAIWLRPRVMKHFLHMNEGLIFVAIIGATIVWGIFGALIIVPLLATAGVVGRYLRARLLRQEPWPESTDNSVLTTPTQKRVDHNTPAQLVKTTRATGNIFSPSTSDDEPKFIWLSRRLYY